MNEDLEPGGAVLGPGLAGVQRVAEAAFQHAEDGFNLRASVVTSLLQMAGHPPAALSLGRAAAAPAALRGDQAVNIQQIAAGRVNPFRSIEAGIAHQDRHRGRASSYRSHTSGRKRRRSLAGPRSTCAATIK